MALNVPSKVAIITGAGSGINFSFAKLLLENKCNVIFADLALWPEAADLVSSYSDENTTPRAIYMRIDVTDWKQLEETFDMAEKEFGHADIICPGAGVFEPPTSNFWIPPGTGSSSDLPQKNRYASFDINLLHPIRCTQLAISHFIKHKTPGSIVLIASIAAQFPYIGCPLYTTSKHAISGFVRSLATLEKPPNPNVPPIRVTAVAPGIVKTPIWLESEKIRWLNWEKDQWVTPEEVADVMLGLIQTDDHNGGSILEVGKNKVRKVEELNDPGPQGDGLTLSAGAKGVEEIWTRLSDPSWGQYT
ncbi:unnamed protein product [Clonostachys rosea f. rosea IK726]|uniref:Uncharacterized protein n=2 Tax=Bionectria ochroleuca TaxID=29856 RepID=A0A0B7KA04_BIOOC|nr:unnamed protein product [Clonostachys rosea f. rosea IK726]